jgi:hypothetical protein
MFKIGDIVKIVRVGTWPLEYSSFEQYIGKEGHIVAVRAWAYDQTMIDLFLFEWDDNEHRSLWCNKEHLQLLSAPQQTKDYSDYKSNCPSCGQKAYINLFDRIDCSNSGCSTKNPSHPRHYS